VFVKLLDDLPDVSVDLRTQVFGGDVLCLKGAFLEWAADSIINRVDDGADTAAKGLTLGRSGTPAE
jgi:hypothetical protein